MKKTIPALLCLLCALAAGTAAFFGCTGGGDNPGGDSGDNTGGGTENSYSITATDGEGYNIKVDKTSAEFGETVTVTVEVTDHDKYVDSVRAGSTTYSISAASAGPSLRCIPRARHWSANTAAKSGR